MADKKPITCRRPSCRATKFVDVGSYEYYNTVTKEKDKVIIKQCAVCRRTLTGVFAS